MAKALFLSLPFHGHTNPSLPLVRELVQRGEEVVYYSSEEFAERVRDAGARYRAYRSKEVADLQSVPSRLEELPLALMRATAAVLGEELDDARAERPDYLIADSVAPWGQWLARVLDVPVVTSITTFALNRKVLATALRAGIRPKGVNAVLTKLRSIAKSVTIGRQLRQKHHVRGPGMMAAVAGSSDLNIVYTSRYFQPYAESFSKAFRFVGPSMEPRSETGTFPWDQLSGGPAVFVSLGTLFNRHPTFYQSCFDAFRDEDVTVIMAVGSQHSHELCERAPRNVHVHRRVPQLELLQRTAAFVTHGGMNSVSEALYFGVPLVVVPQAGEQAIVGRRVAQLGAGISLGADVSAARIRESVRRVLREPSFRDRALLVRDSFLAAGGVAQAAKDILQFTRPS